MARALLARPDVDVNQISTGYRPEDASEMDRDFLLENGQNRTALMFCTRNFGMFEVARLLLARPEIEVNLVDGSGDTALHYDAMIWRSRNYAELLLSHPDIKVLHIILFL